MNRRSTDCGWITRWMAEHADVRSLGDAVAMLVCYVIVAGIAAYVFGLLP